MNMHRKNRARPVESAAASNEPAEISKHYAVVLLYSSSGSSADYRTLYEETVTLIFADSEEDAKERAHRLALSQETEFLNQYGETISWTFNRIVDIAEIANDIGHGAEIYTRHFRDYVAYCAIADNDDEEPQGPLHENSRNIREGLDSSS